MPKPSDYKRAGRALRLQRRRRKLTQKDVSRIAEVSVRTIGSMENGNAQRYGDAPAVMEAVGWTADSWDELLAGREPVSLEVGDFVRGIPEQQKAAARAAIQRYIEQFPDLRRELMLEWISGEPPQSGPPDQRRVGRTG